MKTLMTALILTLVLAPLAFATNYSPLSKDGEVTAIEDVQIRKAVPSEQVDTVSLKDLNAQIARIDAKISALQDKRATLVAERKLVAIEAGKVKLKTKPVEVIK